MLKLAINPSIGINNLRLGMSNIEARSIVGEWFEGSCYTVPNQVTTPPIIYDVYHEGVKIYYDDNDEVEIIEVRPSLNECYLNGEPLSDKDDSYIKLLLKDLGYKMKRIEGVSVCESVGFGYSNSRRKGVDSFCVFRADSYQRFVEKFTERSERYLNEYRASVARKDCG